MHNQRSNLVLIDSWAEELLKDNPILSSKIEAIPSRGDLEPKILLVELLKFLQLVSILNSKLSPSLLVDLTWHEFILFTRSYDFFCKDKLGRFIHHTPDSNQASNHRNYLKTIHYYMEYFGKAPVKIWGELSEEQWKISQCGSCEAQ